MGRLDQKSRALLLDVVGYGRFAARSVMPTHFKPPKSRLWSVFKIPTEPLEAAVPLSSIFAGELA